MLVFHKAPFLPLPISCYVLIIFLLIAIPGDDTTFNSKYDQTFDLWQQLKLASELESNLQDIVSCGTN